MTSRIRLAITLALVGSLFLLAASGCGWRIHRTGVPVERASSFFVYLENAARSRQLSAHRGDESLTILLANGDMLHYYRGTFEIEVTLAPKGEDDKQRTERRHALFELHQSLLAQARRLALANRGF
ncbi:MAG: hypothetical protein KC609_24480 [Myxococcales bacterium]|nr:hypothetical protein [Myxococcales bacterium]